MADPKFPKRDLTQAAVDSITTRMDSYDQQWERRMERLFQGIERMETTANRIGERVEQIADFLGTATEQQKATQLRLETLEEKVDRRFDQLTQTIERLTGSVQEQQRSIDGHLRVAEQQSKNIEQLNQMVLLLLQRVA